jgi:hypothetical protein
VTIVIHAAIASRPTVLEADTDEIGAPDERALLAGIMNALRTLA